MTKDEFVGTLQEIYEKRKLLRASEQARQNEENALAEEYKVNECNAKRQAIIAKYQPNQIVLRQEIFNLENQLGL